MKRVVFLIDKTKKDLAKDLLEKSGITFSYNDRFHFDVRTAIVTGIIVVLLMAAVL